MNADSSLKPGPNRWVTALLIVIVFGAGLFIGRYVLPAAGSINTLPLQFVSVEEGERQLVFPTFWEAWDVLHENYIGNLEEKNLFYGAVAGMIKAAGDPYTIFNTPEETKQLEETLNGSFSGVGIEIGVRGGLIKIIAPLAGSPAELAGLRAGDTIVAVDKEALTSSTTLDEVVQKIRGPKGTEVVLTVVHENANETSDITVTRDTIDIESVIVEVTNQVAHITITSFNADTAGDFSETTLEILRAGARGVILDMRNNPGGFLQSAVDISSEFLPRDTLVVTERGKNDAAREHRTSGRPSLQDIPVVVLVNGGSASASEIVAGALQDQRDIPVIGEKTFGKGSVQDFKKLKDGSSVRVTIAKWFTPDNRSIDDEGIEPDITVEDNPDTEEDEQLIRAQEELLN